MGAFLKKLLGDSYKDDLTIDEIESLLEPKYSNLTKERDSLKLASDKNASEASEFKKKYQEKLNDEEKKALEREEMLKQINGFKREKSIAEQKANYIALGFDEILAQETAQALIDNDFATVMKNQKIVNDKMLEEANKKALTQTPKPPAGDPKTITKEDFKKMNYSQIDKLMREDRATYDRLVKEN